MARAWLNKLHTELWEQQDIDAVLALMSPDLKWRTTVEKQWLGRTEFAQYVKRYLQTGSDKAGILKESSIMSMGEDTCVIALGIVLMEKVWPEERQVLIVCRADDGQLLGERLQVAGCSAVAGQQVMQLMERVPGGLVQCLYNDELTILEVNQGFLEMTGYTREEIKQQFHDSFWEMLEPADREPSWEEVQRQLQNSSTKEIEYRLIRKDGERIWVLDKGQLVVDEQGIASFYCILVDVTRAKKAEEELRLSLELHKIIMDQTNDILIEWDLLRDTLTFSDNWDKLFAYQPISQQIGEHLAQTHIWPPDQPKLKELLQSISAGVPYVECELRIQKQAEQYIWCRIRGTTQFDHTGRPIRAVGVIIDIDDEKRQSQLLLERAQRDTLTRLYNKGAAQALIENRLQSEPLLHQAFYIIDLDNFKQVNDRYGHLFGDAYLIEAAKVIKQIFGEDAIVGRIGGDEFAAFISHLDGQETETRAQQLLQALSDMQLSGIEAAVSCSIGIAESPRHGSDFKTLYHKADCALYQAKRQGKNCFVLYDEASGQEIYTGFSQGLISAINEYIDSDENERHANQELLQGIFQVIYQTEAVDAAIMQMLELIGKKYQVSRVYVFENAEGSDCCRNTFEWCAPGIDPQKEHWQNLSTARQENERCYEWFDENGIFYCSDGRELDGRYPLAETGADIPSILQCAIKDHGQIIGFIGLDDHLVKRFWTKEQIATLHFAAEVISIFLLKNRTQDKMQRSQRLLQKILDHLTLSLCVIDPDSREVVFVNQHFKEQKPDYHAGECCYELLGADKAPCQNCRVERLLASNKKTEVFYSAENKAWLEMSAASITCQDHTFWLLSFSNVSQYYPQ